MDILSLLGSTLGLGMMAGLNLYATVLALGLGIRFHFIHLPATFSHLEVLADPWVLGIAGFAFIVEFAADKVPWVDSAWDSFHTVIRPVGAAILALTAAGGLDPATRTILALLTGAVALTGHTAKAGTRLAVNHSPEPFSNIALSLTEDTVAVFGTWLAVTHPWIAGALVAVFLVLFAIFAPRLWRLLHLEWTALRGALRHLLGFEDQHASLPPGPQSELKDPSLFCIEAIAGPGVRGLKNSHGYLCLTDREMVFIASRAFRRHVRRVPISTIEASTLRKGILIDTLSFTAAGTRIEFLVPKDQRHGSERLAMLQSQGTARQ
ncbi:MAG: DUF4126 domain-containing protein [Bryobacteraceae bacterium]